jgi:Holliday junction resolvasome RuvABC ATP-dependent DNA helicase subunit
MADNGATLERYAQVAQVFTPGAPIDRLDVFAGRLPQILDVINAVSQRGQHVMLYGERGVGKTSLANVIADIFASKNLEHLDSISVNCNTNDTFGSLWRTILRDLRLDLGADADYEDPSPEDVRFYLQQLRTRTLIVIDELDRLENDEALSLLADTIKTLSDHAVDATLALVGVADNVDELIGDHRSVERALVQIPLPRMSKAELMEIIDKRLDRLDMKIESGAKERIARLSEGLPYYTHLLALHAGQYAVTDQNAIGDSAVEMAIDMAVQKAQHSIRRAYQEAIRSPQKDNLNAQVLLACALAEKDFWGFFTAAAVRDPMSAIMKRRYEIPAFARHLNKLSDEGRVPRILIQRGQPRKYIYRFEDPLLQPFVILSSLSSGMIDERLLEQFQGMTASPDAIESQQLF